MNRYPVMCIQGESQNISLEGISKEDLILAATSKLGKPLILMSGITLAPPLSDMSDSTSTTSYS